MLSISLNLCVTKARTFAIRGLKPGEGSLSQDIVRDDFRLLTATDWSSPNI